MDTADKILAQKRLKSQTKKTIEKLRVMSTEFNEEISKSKNEKIEGIAWFLSGIVALIGGVSGFGTTLYFGDSFGAIILTVFFCLGSLITFGIGLFKTVRANKNEVRSNSKKLIDAQSILKENRALMPTDSQGFNAGETFLRCLDELGKSQYI